MRPYSDFESNWLGPDQHNPISPPLGRPSPELVAFHVHRGRQMQAQAIGQTWRRFVSAFRR